MPRRLPAFTRGAADALLSAVEQDVPGDCTLSMSGGLDSRLLLAACLATGRRPRLLISGVPGSFDREVATLIARRLGATADVTTVTANDVVRDLPSIAAITNGLIPAGNWAGIAHVRSAVPGAAPVLFGFNGEVARLYYGPRTGMSALLAARSVPRQDQAVLLGQRFESPFAPQERHWLGRGLRAALEPAAVTPADPGDRRAAGWCFRPGRPAIPGELRAAEARQRPRGDRSARVVACPPVRPGVRGPRAVAPAALAARRPVSPVRNRPALPPAARIPRGRVWPPAEPERPGTVLAARATASATAVLPGWRHFPGPGSARPAGLPRRAA